MSRSRIATSLSPCTSTSALSSGSNSTRSSTCTVRACGPAATTRDHTRRREAIAAVAGITMPPAERRSPFSWSTSTRSRSWSILMGSFADTATSVGGDLADHGEQHRGSDHATDDLEDVGRPGLTGPQVDEVALDRGDLTPRDRLGAGAVDQLVDGARQALTRVFHLGLERGGLLGHAGKATNGRACRLD